jgi:hypothetical protein
MTRNTDHDNDLAQLARLGQAWDNDLPLDRVPTDGAGGASLWLRAVLAIGAVCITVAIIAALWGRV